MRYFNDGICFYFLGPLSVDRFPEVDDDVDVDVEQCSDSEATPRTPRVASTTLASPPSPSDEDRLSPEPAQVSLIIGFWFYMYSYLSCVVLLHCEKIWLEIL